MQHYYIYPEAKAVRTNPLLIKKGWTEENFNNLQEIAKDLETRLNNVGITLMTCDWRNSGQLKTIWNIKVSTPGHCDIFDLLDAIRKAFDMNGMDEQFTGINTSYNNKEVYIEFTVSC